MKVKLAEFMHTIQFGSTHSDLRPPAIPSITLFSAVPTAAANPWIPTQNQQVPSVKNRPDPNI